MNAHTPILTERLELALLTPPVLRALAEGQGVSAGELLGIAGAFESPGGESLFRMRLGQIERDPGVQPFLLRAMIPRETRVPIGHIGFHAEPDARYLRKQGLTGLEMGYTVFEAHRRRGYATEATAALMRWAHKNHGVADFVLSIAPDNEPSLRIARRFGFRFHSQYNDPEDGIEDVYVGRCPFPDDPDQKNVDLVAPDSSLY